MVVFPDGMVNVPDEVNTCMAVNPPALGVCQVAAVELVAINACPAVGAVAPLTDTVVVADFIPYAIASVQLERLPLEGVPSTGVTSVTEPVIVPPASNSTCS
jgi:hypothetical protein